jgi:hypothetical protein
MSARKAQTTGGSDRDFVTITVRRDAYERAQREIPRLRRETQEHLRRLRRLIDGLPPDW